MSLPLHNFTSDPAARTATAQLIPTPGFDLQEALDRLVVSGATDVLDQVDAHAGWLRRPLHIARGYYMAHLSIAPEIDPLHQPLRLHLAAADDPYTPTPSYEIMQEAAEWANRRFYLDVEMEQVRQVLVGESYGAELVARFWPMRPVNFSDGWACLMKTVLSNQVYPGLVRIMGERLRAHYGPRTVFNGEVYHLWPFADALAEADFETLRSFHFSRQKASYLPAIGQAVAQQPDRYDVMRLRFVPSAEAIATLCELFGVGPWTAQYVAMRGLPHPDVFIDEKSLREHLGAAMGIGAKVNDSLFRRLTEPYAPYRSFACFYAYSARFGIER